MERNIILETLEKKEGLKPKEGSFQKDVVISPEDKENGINHGLQMIDQGFVKFKTDIEARYALDASEYFSDVDVMRQQFRSVDIKKEILKMSQYHVAQFDVGQLFTDVESHSYSEIQKRAIELGLRIIPAALVPRIASHYDTFNNFIIATDLVVSFNIMAENKTMGLWRLYRNIDPEFTPTLGTVEMDNDSKFEKNESFLFIYEPKKQ